MLENIIVPQRNSGAQVVGPHWLARLDILSNAKENCYSKYSPLIVATSESWLEMQNFKPQPDLLDLNSHFNMVFGCLIDMLKLKIIRTFLKTNFKLSQPGIRQVTDDPLATC